MTLAVKLPPAAVTAVPLAALVEGFVPSWVDCLLLPEVTAVVTAAVTAVETAVETALVVLVLVF